MARRFVAESAKVVVAELDETTGRAAAEEFGSSALFVRTDVTVGVQRGQGGAAHADRTAAREWAPTGVVVSDHPELEQQASRENPMGWVGDPS